MEFPALVSPRQVGRGWRGREGLFWGPSWRVPRPAGPGPSPERAPDARSSSRRPWVLQMFLINGSDLCCRSAAARPSRPASPQPHPLLPLQPLGGDSRRVGPLSVLPRVYGVLDRTQCWDYKDQLASLLSWRVGRRGSPARPGAAPCHVVNTLPGQRGGLCEHTVGPLLFYWACAHVCACRWGRDHAQRTHVHTHAHTRNACQRRLSGGQV